MKIALTIALFCAGGGLASYYLSGWGHSLFGWEFPYGTFAVNVIGAYFIRLIKQLGLCNASIPRVLRIGFTAGSTKNLLLLYLVQHPHGKVLGPP